ncbi:MAG TPA: ribokinase [Acidobacteriaceae bacterium]|jgi:ribokinase|nr:ribokinase [Acidobacteriaceae bacterium]
MSENQKPIVVVGSINIDLVVTALRIPVAGETLQGDGFQQHFGGKGANQAIAAARLGYPVQMIGRIGTDAAGAEVRESLRAEGVEVDAVETVEGSSGIAAITVSRTGENAIVVVPGANAHVTPEYLDKHENLIRDGGIVLAQLEIPIPTIVRLAAMCHRHRIPFVLDPAPAQPLPAEVLSATTWFTPNETEAQFFAATLFPDAKTADPERMAEAFLHSGVRSVVLKLGARGVLMAGGGSYPTLIPGMKIDAVDTTAAGDAFNGAFATALMRGMEPDEAARFACAAAAISVTRHGAQPSMPTNEEVLQLLRDIA